MLFYKIYWSATELACKILRFEFAWIFVNNLYKIWTYDILYKILLWNLLSFHVYLRDILKNILPKCIVHFLRFLQILCWFMKVAMMKDRPSWFFTFLKIKIFLSRNIHVIGNGCCTELDLTSIRHHLIYLHSKAMFINTIFFYEIELLLISIILPWAYGHVPIDGHGQYKSPLILIW
jgi:hypothetical protein